MSVVMKSLPRYRRRRACLVCMGQPFSGRGKHGSQAVVFQTGPDVLERWM